jgi:putative methanogen marker protein 4
VIDSLIRMAQNMPATIGVGISTPIESARRTVDAALRALWNGYAKRIFLVGSAQTFDELEAVDASLETIVTDDPESDLVKLLDGQVNAIVRGSLSATGVLSIIKSRLRLSSIARLALLETVAKQAFFFAPVGIDEGRNVKEKLFFIREGMKLIRSLGDTPKVAVLSGGRFSDVGRDKGVDNTLREAEDVVKDAQREFEGLDIKHYEILIEDAIAEKANLIIAPGGISGNLIYRTLIHLGGGTSYGATYLGLPKPIIDTSRAGPVSEYTGAIAMASAFVTKT